MKNIILWISSGILFVIGVIAFIFKKKHIRIKFTDKKPQIKRKYITIEFPVKEELSAN